MHRFVVLEALEPRRLLSRAVGIDVSNYQGSPTWSSVYASGVQFAYVKATQGDYYVDPAFASDMSNASAASVVVGAYDFADYTVPATTEASDFLSTAGAYVGAGFLRPMIDVEASTSDTAAQVSTWVNAWCNAVYQASGVQPIVYTYVSYAQSYLNSSVTQWPLWMANYNGQNAQTGGPSGISPWSSWAMWQYSSSGSVGGISGNVDMDVANGDMTSYVIPDLVGGSTQFSPREVIHVSARGGVAAWDTYASNGTSVIEPNNTNGVIMGGPVYINGALRWPVQYAGSRTISWSVGASLVKGGVPTITGLSGSPNPLTSGATLTLTANVSDPSSTVSGVAFYRESNGTAGLQTGSGGDVLIGHGAANGSGGWTLSTSTAGLSGTYTYYAVATDSGGPTSAAASTSVNVEPPVAVTGAAVNGDNAALTGAQRSMVDSIVYTFNQAVTLAATNAFTIGVHAGESGTAPSLAWAAISPAASGASTQWVVTFTGAGVVGNSIANGVYDITLDPSAVAVAGSPGATVTARPTDTFYRLFGDVQGTMSVNSADALKLKAAQSTYNAAFDFDGNGVITSSDLLQFKKDQSASYNGDGFTTTI